MSAKICDFCKQEFVPKTSGQVYCSVVCKRAAYYVRSIKGRERAKEEADFQRALERKREGLQMHICATCLRPYFALAGMEFCSTPCRDIYNAQDAHNGQKLPRDVVSMGVLRENEAKESARQRPVKMRKKGYLNYQKYLDRIGYRGTELPFNEENYRKFSTR